MNYVLSQKAPILYCVWYHKYDPHPQSASDVAKRDEATGGQQKIDTVYFSVII